MKKKPTTKSKTKSKKTGAARPAKTSKPKKSSTTLRAKPAKPSPKRKQPAKPKPASKAKNKPLTTKSTPSTPSPRTAAKASTTPAPAIKPIKLSSSTMEKYRSLLLDLRDHLIDGVNFLASDNLKRSSREVSGELSGYSLHMADAGTDNFDREFALSLVSSEQEALYEIEEALKRLEHGSFGACEICEKPIPSERLEAVPFARMCVPCQSGIERDRRRPAPPTAVFSETVDEEGAEGEESEE